ncbi:V-type proton ATPase subunit G-like [Saccoglossus kowalevskii]|uniref:V-type proton ATPase subunit G n=1 Tax=Saccoglossus kowalevskii TaxID=10224 RepID=A0ABM0GJ59_SACKO|nr:PREDICTED: V-type proton ATPase subunit G-like [Saccoglossus kowalevskii]
MAAQTTGIQQLLQAEKRAAEKVGEARKRKARRLKQAKEEAQSEIEAYRAEREKLFIEHQQKHLGSKDDKAREVEVQTKQKIAEVNKNVEVTKEEVLSKLLGLVYDITPELHQNLRD